jgi:hypothetical protein
VTHVVLSVLSHLLCLCFLSVFSVSIQSAGHPSGFCFPTSDDTEVDHLGSVDFDLLDGFDSLCLMTINSESVIPYSSFQFPLGSVHSASSSQVAADC